MPAATSLSPNSATAGGSAFTLTVNGTGFANGSTISWNGAPLATSYVSAVQLTATVPASDIATAANILIAVTNATPGGGTSPALAFTVAVANAVPVLSGITPSSATAGGAAFTLTVSGTNFVKGAIVNWNGAPLATAFVSATQLTAAVPAVDLESAGVVPVTVTNAAPGGGPSAAATFTVSAAIPGATLTPTGLGFGSVATGATSTSQNVVLANPGTAPLTTISIATTTGFLETNTCGSSLAPGANCTIAVTFSPVATANATGLLAVADNATGSPQTVALSGTGTEPLTIAATSGGSTSATVSSSSGTATYNLTLSGSSGFSGAVSLSCSGAPVNATCQVSPSQVMLTSSGTAGFQVTVKTGSGSTAMLREVSTLRLAGCGLAAMLLLPFVGQCRKLVRKGTLLMMLALVFLALSGCGGGNSSTTTSPGSSVTPAGTYTLTVTASTANVSTAQSLTLVVE